MHENQFNYQTLMTLTARRLILIIINWDEKFVFYFQFCFLVQHNNVAISSPISGERTPLKHIHMYYNVRYWNLS